MNLEALRNEISAARQRYEAFRGDPASLDGVLQELGITLEELQVASEELASQGDRLSTLQEKASAIARRQRSRFEQAPLAHLVTDLDGMIREANRAAEGLFGRSPAALAKLPIVALASAPERFPLRARIVQMQGEPPAGPRQWNLWLRHPTRGPFEASVWVSRSLGADDAESELLWIVAPRSTLPPPSAAGQLPLVLAETAEDLADGIVLCDAKGAPLWWNSAFLAASGVPAKDLVERGVAACIADRGAEPGRVAARLREIEAAPTPAPPERIRLRDGRTIALGVRARRMEGAVIGRSWTIRDVTFTEEASRIAERLESELARSETNVAALRRAHAEAEGATAEKVRLLGALAHEIRNPMNALLGAVALVRETDLCEEQAEYVEMVERSGARVVEIIRGVLDLARMQAGHYEVAAAEFDLIDVVEGTVRSACAAPSARGVEIGCRIGPDVPHRVVGDPHALGQVLENLLGNALKFTEHGAVTVTLCRETDPGSPDLLRLTVADTGPGIEPERLATIFEPFGPGGLARQRHGGTGLGLSITKEIVERLGGSLRVDSTVGRGSVFTARLALPPAETQPPKLQPFATRPRILVGDGDRTSREALVETLRSWNADVVEAVDAESVRERVGPDGARIALLVLDVRLAGRSDFALLEHLRAATGVVGRTLVVLPVRHRQGDVARLRELGVGAWILKPLRRGELYARLTTMLEPASS